MLSLLALACALSGIFCCKEQKPTPRSLRKQEVDYKKRGTCSRSSWGVEILQPDLILCLDSPCLWGHVTCGSQCKLASASLLLFSCGFCVLVPRVFSLNVI